MPVFFAKSGLARVLFTFALISWFLLSSGNFALADAPTINGSGVFTLANSLPRVDGASGALTQHISLDFPPGRNGLQPNLSLDYSSQNTDKSSLVGYGWSLSIPYIERMNKTGTQDLYGSNARFASSLDGELTPPVTPTVKVLVVAGGGGGNGGSYLGGGGGGGGGVVASSTYTVTTGTTTITVGAGGSGNGGNSVFGTITAIGGGGGGYGTPGAGKDGNSGGSGGGGGCWGSGGSGTTTQGTSGGGGTGQNSCAGGGGGGAGSAGASSPNWQTGGNGGSGVYSSITGSYYGGGGGGGGGTECGQCAGGAGGRGGGGGGGVVSNAGNGTANTGGGGGGTLNFSATSYSAGAGGSGIVIITYPTTVASNYSCGGTQTTSGVNTICTYTSSGSFAVNSLPTSPDSDPNTYRARVDDGSYRRYTYATSTNSWTMYDKNGTKYLFGASSQSQQSATTSPSAVYKWMLEKVVDPNGNFIRYTYVKNYNQIYPYQIFYTGQGSTDGPTVITFATTTRTDTVSDYRPGFRVVTNYKISSIIAAFNGNNVRQYNLSYSAGNNGSRSLLSSVQETGWDDVGVQATLPPTAFTYVSSTTPFIGPGGQSIRGPASVVTDLDGDGINDTTSFYRRQSDGALRESFYFDGGSSNSDLANAPDYWANNDNCVTCMDTFHPVEQGVRFLDINGDGKADVVDGTSGTIYTNNSSVGSYSWSATSFNGVIPPFQATGKTGGLFADLNGTGLPSFVQRVDGYVSSSTYIANGSAWNAATTSVFLPPMSFPNGSPSPTNPQLVDINGDGLADWVYSDDTNTYVLMNTGTGWESSPDPAWTIATSTLYKSTWNGTTVYYDRGIRFMDVNGDGLPDMVHAYAKPGGTMLNQYAPLPEMQSYSEVSLNTGHGWAAPIPLGGAITNAYYSDGTNYSWRSSNFYFDEFSNWIGNGQMAQDVLSTVTYPKGGSMSVTYGYTTQSGTNQQLPYNLLVVTKTVNHDGQGSNEETNYSYTKGLQYLPSGENGIYDRKLGGFASTTETHSDKTIVTYYNQGNGVDTSSGEQSDGYAQINHPYRKDTLTSLGALVQKVLYDWEPHYHGNSTFVAVNKQIQMDYASDGSHQDKVVEYTYATTTDDLISQYDHGTPGKFDGRITQYTYAASSTINLTVPVEKQVLQINLVTSTVSTTSLAAGTGVVTLYLWGGGGSGGGWGPGSTAGGGGGAGSYVSTTKSVSSGNSFTIKIGLGASGKTGGLGFAAGGNGAQTSGGGSGGGGGSTAFDTGGTPIIAAGGGGGASGGGFGGSGASSASGGAGGTGGANAGGGGGANTAGSGSTPGTGATATSGTNGSGGDPSGSTGGGGGSSAGSSGNGQNGSGATPGAASGAAITDSRAGGPGAFNPGTTGGVPGAGGGGNGGTGPATGGNGQVIISAPTSVGITATGGTHTTSGGNDYWTFTADGTWSISGFATTSTLISTTTTTTVASDQQYLYDNLPFGSVASGNQTKEQAWVSGSHYASSTKTYNSYGLVTQSTDRNGNAASYSYDSYNLYPATVTNPLSQSTQYTYNYSNGKAKQTTDPNSSLSKNIYDGLGRLIETDQSDVSNPASFVTKSTIAYTDSTTPSLVHETDYLNSASTTDTYNYYDGLSRLIQGRKSSGTAGTYVVTDSRYNTAGLLSSQSLPYFSSGSSNTSATATNSLYTNYLYDPLGRKTAIGTSVGTRTNVYAKWTTTTTDPDGHIKDYITDAYNNLIQVVEHGSSGNATTTYTYDAAGNLATTTDGANNVRYVTYDGLGRRLAAQDLHALGHSQFGVWSYTYDDGSNVLSQVDPNGATTTRTYDILNRLLTESAGGATQVTNTYDSCANGIGRLCIASTTVTQTQNAYDALGRAAVATTTIAGTSFVTTSAYDRQGNVTNLTYPDSSQVAYTYNLAGQISRVQQKPASGSWADIVSAATYAPTGQLLSVAFGNGASTTNTYDANSLYRLTAKLTLLPNGTHAQDFSYIYDAVGNILGLTNNATTTNSASMAYQYDALNRLISANTTSAVTSPYSQTYSYDSLGNILSLTTGASLTPSIIATSSDRAPGLTTSDSFAFNAGSASTNTALLVAFEGSGGAPTSATYNGQSLTLQTWTGQAGYDAIGYLVNPASGSHTFSISYPNQSNPLYRVFVLKNVKQSTPVDVSGQASSAAASSCSVSLTTTGADFLFATTLATSSANPITEGSGQGEVWQTQPYGAGTSWWAGATKLTQAAGSQSMSFGYNTGSGACDSVLVALNSASSTSVATTSTYTYGQTGYANPDAVTSISDGTNTTTYAYDKNGNLTSAVTTATTTTYGYDYLNRLTAIATNGATTTTFAYDALGNRMSQTVNGVVTMYPNKYFSKIFSTSGATTTATSTSYAWSGDSLLSYVEQALVNGTPTGSSTTFYVHPDHLGSTNITTTASGAIQNAKDYLPFGAVRVNSGGSSLGRGYINQFEDSSGLDYLNARYYEGSRGQFLSQDPTFLAIGNPSQLQQLTKQDQQRFLTDPQQMNSYSYARGNPITNKDPDGNFAPAIAYAAITAPEWGPAVLWGIGAAATWITADIALRSNGNNWGTRWGGTVPTLDPGKMGFGPPPMGPEDWRSNFDNKPPWMKIVGIGSIITMGVADFAQPIWDKYQSLTNRGPQGQQQLNSQFNSSSIQTRVQATQTYNSATGASSPQQQLWVTPNGAVINWSGGVIAPAPSSKK